MAERYISAAEAAALLGLAPRTVRYLARPRIMTVRAGRASLYREADVRRLAAARQQKQAPIPSAACKASGAGSVTTTIPATSPVLATTSGG